MSTSVWHSVSTEGGMSARTARAELMEVIQRRMQNGADLLARSLTTPHLKDVASAAGFPEMLLTILRNTPAVDPDDLRAAERHVRTAEFKAGLIMRAGGALTAEQVKKLLGHKSVQAVYKAVATRRLLAVDDSGRRLFPAIQFDGDAIVPGIAPVLAAAPNTSPWSLLQFIVDGDEGLGEERPEDMLKGSAEAIERLTRFAGVLED